MVILIVLIITWKTKNKKQRYNVERIRIKTLRNLDWMVSASGLRAAEVRWATSFSQVACSSSISHVWKMSCSTSTRPPFSWRAWISLTLSPWGLFSSTFPIGLQQWNNSMKIECYTLSQTGFHTVKGQDMYLVLDEITNVCQILNSGCSPVYYI